ncbi:hypothetical protein ACQ4PT_019921 [Festuca glaucescens]
MALRLFREMQALGFDRRALPYATLLSVAGSLPHIGIGKQINAQLNTLLLKAMPGLNDTGKALLGPFSEQVMAIQNIGSPVLVSENQVPLSELVICNHYMLIMHQTELINCPSSSVARTSLAHD